MRKVSVIIPAYNSAGCIKGALESVLNQEYENLETIVVNDGSTDDLETVLRPYMTWGLTPNGPDPIKYIATENRGVSHAINTGLGEATGDYICFLHADDRFLPGKIRKQTLLMERLNRYGVSYTNSNFFLEGSQDQGAIESPYPSFSGDIFYFLKRSNFIHMSTVMLRKEIARIITFDETLTCHEEWDVFLKLSRKGVRFLYIKEVLSSISVSEGNLSSNRDIMDRTRAIVGGRAKELWGDFKEDISFHSIAGISNLMRYIKFKLYARIVGFPKHPRFNRMPPREAFQSHSRIG